MKKILRPPKSNAFHYAFLKMYRIVVATAIFMRIVDIVKNKLFSGGYIMAAKTIEHFLMDYPLIDDWSVFWAREIWKAATEAAEEKLTPTNKQNTPCNCGNPSVVHFCQSCLKTHDDYCKIPF
jgi:hypothetical protein